MDARIICLSQRGWVRVRVRGKLCFFASFQGVLFFRVIVSSADNNYGIQKMLERIISEKWKKNGKFFIWEVFDFGRKTCEKPNFQKDCS